MHILNCTHSCKPVSPGVAVYEIGVNGVTSRYVVNGGTCHDAAYLSQQFALVIARALGLKNVMIRTTSPLVRNQLNRVWIARKAGTKRNLARCRVLGRGMNVVHA